MKNLEDIEILAALENLRIRYGRKIDADFALRAASAIVALAIGYNDRFTWTQQLLEQGLIASEYDPDGKDRAKILDKRLMDKLDRNTKQTNRGSNPPD